MSHASSFNFMDISLLFLCSFVMFTTHLWSVLIAPSMASCRCRIHIDGEQETEVDVPSHMLNAGVVMKKGVVESQHPYSNNLDK